MWRVQAAARALVLLVLPLVLSSGCRAQNTSHRAGGIPYILSQPDTTFVLPGRLKEISGLTLFDDSTLAAVQDEVGKVYLVDFRTGDVRDEWRFRKKGDYEGIERVGDTLFVLRSDGTLFAISEWDRKDPRVSKHDTPLSSRFDTEGLAYDEAHNQLLIACKEYPGQGLAGKRAVYAFSLETMQLQPVPVYTVDAGALSRSVQASEKGGLLSRFLRTRVDIAGIKPASIAFHPQSGELYVVSSVAKMLFALRPDRSLGAASRIPEGVLKQPEGMAFLPDGTLFIATEGSDKGRLARFSPR
jgi:uncharacterized protein YjiK